MTLTDILPNNTMLSPLAGYTDAGFRLLASRYGAGLTVTEMVSARALCYSNAITKDLLYTFDEEKFPVLQLFGNESYSFCKALELPETQRFRLIDINMGCPMPKIVRNGDGSALMLQPEKASEIIKSIKKVRSFVSVKIRTGIVDNSLAVDFARTCEQAGADMLTIHGRFARQMYSGSADWDTIAKVVEAVNIPVFANGDVADEQSYLQIKAQTNCYGVAIGRGALGKPYLFSKLQSLHYNFDIYSAICEHINCLLVFLPEKVVVNVMKKHICYYLKGLRGSKTVLQGIQQAQDIACIKNMLSNFLV